MEYWLEQEIAHCVHHNGSFQRRIGFSLLTIPVVQKKKKKRDKNNQPPRITTTTTTKQTQKTLRKQHPKQTKQKQQQHTPLMLKTDGVSRLC